MIASVLRKFCLLIVWLLALGCAAWAFGALYFDFPIARSIVAWGYVAVLLIAMIAIHGVFKKLATIFLVFALVLAWWWTQKPSNDRRWQPDVAQTAWAEINGDVVTIHNVRNCDYRTETDYTPRWETRTVNLSKLKGIDMAITYWGSPWMAHPIVSFQFDDALPVAFSIETRKEEGESYSAIGGLYRQYELIYIAADERDVIGLRTNYRQGEDSYLYRLMLTPEQVRDRFMEYLNEINALHAQPRWYNALTTNCTTSIRTQHPEAKRAKWDWRMLVNGKGDEMLYERKGLGGSDLPFAELKERNHINTRAKAADKAENFSQQIRVGAAGFN